MFVFPRSTPRLRSAAMHVCFFGVSLLGSLFGPLLGSLCGGRGGILEAQVPNDDCAFALPIPFDVPIGFDTTNATASGALDPCTGQLVVDVWYAFTALCSGPMEIDVCNANFDTVLALYPYSFFDCPPDTVIDCNDNGCGSGSRIVFTAEEGGFYLLQIGGKDFATGGGELLLRGCAVTDLTCSGNFANSTAQLSWQTNGIFDNLAILIDGAEVAVLPSGQQSYTTPPLGSFQSHEICVEARVDGAAEFPICCTVDLQPAPVANLQCTVLGNAFAVSWSNPGGLDAINVSVDGVFVAQLSGNATFTSLPVGPGGTHQVCVQGVASGVEAPERCCGFFVPGFADFQRCSEPQATIVSGSERVESIQVPAIFPIETVQLWVDVTHAFVSDLDLTLSSPTGTVVQLHNGGGVGENMHVLFSDSGEPNAPPYNCFCTLQPSGGPLSSGTGGMADFLGDSALGEWVVRVSDNVPGFDGVLNQLCLQLFSQPCSVSPPANLACEMASIGVDLVWTNPQAYDEIWILRDEQLIGIVTGSEQFFNDAGTGVGQRYRVIGVVAGCGATSGCDFVEFRRGDVDGSGNVVTLLDSLFLLNYGFAGGQEPPCLLAADSNGDGNANTLVDALYLLNFGFSGGPSLPAPYPDCGFGSTLVTLSCDSSGCR